MKLNRVRLLLSVLLLGAFSVRADIVYENTENVRTNVFNTVKRHGDEINLTGTAREVTRFTFQYFGDVNAAPGATGTIRFFANDGPMFVFAGGTKQTEMPGTLLWQSNPFEIIDGYSEVALTVPHIVVPTRFTWTIDFSGLPGGSGKTAGLVISGPATIGAPLNGGNIGSYNDLWVQTDPGKADSWALFTFGGGVPADFYARVSAVSGAAPPLVAQNPVIDDGGILLNWTGGTPPFRVRFRPSVADAWLDLSVTASRSYSSAIAGGNGFYQVVETPVVAGPFVSHPPSVGDEGLILSWDGGYPPFRVQSKAEADGDWADLATTDGQSYTTTLTSDVRFYRILDAFN